MDTGEGTTLAAEGEDADPEGKEEPSKGAAKGKSRRKKNAKKMAASAPAVNNNADNVDAEAEKEQELEDQFQLRATPPPQSPSMRPSTPTLPKTPKLRRGFSVSSDLQAAVDGLITPHRRKAMAHLLELASQYELNRESNIYRNNLLLIGMGLPPTKNGVTYGYHSKSDPPSPTPFPPPEPQRPKLTPVFTPSAPRTRAQLAAAQAEALSAAQEKGLDDDVGMQEQQSATPPPDYTPPTPNPKPEEDKPTYSTPPLDEMGPPAKVPTPATQPPASNAGPTPSTASALPTSLSPAASSSPLPEPTSPLPQPLPERQTDGSTPPSQPPPNQSLTMDM